VNNFKFILPDVSLRAYRVWQRNRDSYLRFYKANLLGNLGEPLMYLFGMGIGIGGYLTLIEGVSYIEFIAPGLIMIPAMYSASFECTFGSFTRMSEQKTYDGILATPLNVGDLVIGEILWGATKSLISGSIMFIVIYLSGFMKSSVLMIVPLLMLVFLVGLLFSSLAMTATSLSPSYDFFNYFFTLILAPMFFFSGTFFPLSHFPSWVKIVSDFMPLTHAVNISRNLLSNVTYSSPVFSILILIIYTVIFSVLSIHLIEKRILR
jgi:lipooligosaccharide transport system permease protein